jgi:hypothetical protein
MALGSMYDYLLKFILIGPSGCGKYVCIKGVLMVDRVYCIGFWRENGRDWVVIQSVSSLRIRLSKWVLGQGGKGWSCRYSPSVHPSPFVG